MGDFIIKIAVPIGFFGFQHYLSMLGSLVLIPLVIVPAMGGRHVSVSVSKLCLLFNLKVYAISNQG